MCGIWYVKIKLMKNKTLWAGAIIILLIVGFFGLNSYEGRRGDIALQNQNSGNNTETTQPKALVVESKPISKNLTLDSKTWTWVSTTYSDGKVVKPKQTGKFTLKFASGNKFSATTDCNSMSGSYVADKDTVSFSQIASTLKHCEGTQEGDFSAMLSNVKSYNFNSQGGLVFTLKYSSGTALFR